VAEPGPVADRLPCHAELVEHFGEDAGDSRGLAAFDLATVQHADWPAILE
jgi:hypothetical protein